MPRPALPNVNGSGAVNAEGSNQASRGFLSFGRLASRITFARCPPEENTFVVFVWVVTVKGPAVCMMLIAPSEKPPKIRAAGPVCTHLRPLPKGNSYRKLQVTRWLISSAEGPLS